MKKSTLRLWLLAGFLGLLLGSAGLLPEHDEIKPSMLATELPISINNLTSEESQVGDRERKILAKDTEFERRVYFDRSDHSVPSVEVSIVFSGKDMNNSIHRPEVCLRAQGWNFLSESFIELETGSDLMPKLSMKKIVCEKALYDEAEMLLNLDGDPVIIKRVFYYTFFGHKKIVAGHFERVWEDIKDRLIGGYDQRWAYATFSTSLVSLRQTENGISERELPQDVSEEALEKTVKFIMNNHISLEN